MCGGGGTYSLNPERTRRWLELSAFADTSDMLCLEESICEAPDLDFYPNTH